MVGDWEAELVIPKSWVRLSHKPELSSKKWVKPAFCCFLFFFSKVHESSDFPHKARHCLRLPAGAVSAISASNSLVWSASALLHALWTFITSKAILVMLKILWTSRKFLKMPYIRLYILLAQPIRANVLCSKGYIFLQSYIDFPQIMHIELQFMHKRNRSTILRQREQQTGCLERNHSCAS